MDAKKSVVLIGVVACLAANRAMAQTPAGSGFTYQGRLTDQGSPANGWYDMVFQLSADAAGSSLIGSELEKGDLSVVNGLFAVKLDFGASAFPGQARWLRIGVRPGTSTGSYTYLAPLQELTPGPYAILAASASAVSWANVTGKPAGFADNVDNDVLAQLSCGLNQVAKWNGTAWQCGEDLAGAGSLWQQAGSNIFYSTGRVGVGTNAPGYLLDVFGNSAARSLTIYNPEARPKVELQTNDTIGGMISVQGPLIAGDYGVLIRGAESYGGGQVVLNDRNQLGSVDLSGDHLSGGARLQLGHNGGLVHEFNASNHQINTFGADGQEKMRLWSDSFGAFFLWDSNQAQTVHLTSQGGGGGAELLLYNGTSNTARLDANRGNGGAQLLLSNGTTNTFNLDAKALNDAATLLMSNGTYNTFRIDAKAYGFGSQLHLYDSAGRVAHQITAENRAYVVFNTAGQRVIELKLDGGGLGRTVTQVLEITGGSDLSEQFDVTADETPQPGQVVCIDAENPGKLLVSRKAYDRSVAGVISGAGGVRPGMLMKQAETAADGEHPVALTGRVHVRAEASRSSIEPGDLLTTSDVEGHAMKVLDHTRAQGAILGKAMSRLAAGEKGLVLVLVTLQ